MELPVIAGILGMGYYFNRNNREAPKNCNEPKNMYESKRSIKIRRDQFGTAEKVFNEPNRIIAGPPKIDPTILFNKVDYEDNKLPIEFQHYDKSDIYTDIKVNPVTNQPQDIYYTNSPTAGGWYGISLTGEPIDPNAFRHNNMVPFFGGTVKQNVDEKANNTLLENFTGNINYYEEKKEIGPFFAAENNIRNPYGMASFTSWEQNRYIPSKIMNNVGPVEQVRVGPGLNQGYTAQPSGGFQQANSRDYVLPKTVDELRVRTNPKLTYYGRVLPGVHIGKPAKIGLVQKQNPDSFFINSPDRYFTTVGVQTAARMRPNVVMKNVNRKTTTLKRRIGPAGPTRGSKFGVRPGIKVSNKMVYGTDGFRNMDASGNWTIDNGAPHDYGKKSIKLRHTIRPETATCVRTGNVAIQEGQEKAPIYNKQRPRTTKKIVQSARAVGNVDGVDKKGFVRDPNDVARTTIKEQNIENEYEGNMQPQQPANPVVWDPNDVARTTIKEQNIDNENPEGYMDMGKPPNGPVYDPNDVARTTIKETNIENEYEGNMQPQQASNAPVYDPNDVAKTTIKETNIDNDRLGIVGNSQLTGNTVRDPDDIPKTTTKETTLSESQLKPAYFKQDAAYEIASYRVPGTTRQVTSRQYGGNAAPTNKEQGAYLVTSNKIRNTTRQFQIRGYDGVAGSGVLEKPGSREAIKNSITRSYREEVSKGRAPTKYRSEVRPPEINMTTKKLGDIQSYYINQRGLAPTKVYNSLPTPATCGITKDRMGLPNEIIQDRLDSSILDAFRRNPYTHPLTSYVF